MIKSNKYYDKEWFEYNIMEYWVILNRTQPKQDYKKKIFSIKFQVYNTCVALNVTKRYGRKIGVEACLDQV